MVTDAQKLADDILSGTLPASAAMRRPDVYEALNRGASEFGLPFLGTSSKIDAGAGVGVLTKVLYMMAAGASGREACPDSSAACRAVCLVEHTGRMSMTNAVRARRRRHASFFADRARFLSTLAYEIVALGESARRTGKIPAVRLNGTTDLPWVNMRVNFGGRQWDNLYQIAAAHGVRTYDYTKARVGTRSYPDHHYTFSLSDHPESNARAVEWLRHGSNVAVVFDVAKGCLPDTYKIGGTDYPVIDGDKHDARFLDPAGVIVGLSAKGRAKGTGTVNGFVRTV
jgi:hypothetical protein